MRDVPRNGIGKGIEGGTSGRLKTRGQGGSREIYGDRSGGIYDDLLEQVRQ